MKKREVEDLAEKILQDLGLRAFRRNCRFVPGRRYLADFYWPDLRLALEIDGGVFMRRGGHTTGAGYTKDRERDIEALLAGVLTVRYTSSQVRDGYLLTTFPTIYRARAKEVGG